MALDDDAVLKRLDGIVKSAEDKRNYRCLVLKNQLKVIIVSDPTADKSAASLDVFAGTAQDDPDVEGLAHFCEHMLFMGTEKYPETNEYNQYLCENGGLTNAFTLFNQTRYFFDILPEAFNGALDRFAQFFISPLFDANNTDKELNAVDSENEKNILSDNWRIQAVIQCLAKESHPFAKLGIGSLKTLKEEPLKRNINIRERLLNFYQKYYSANLMTLAIVDRQSLDELERLVVEKFLPIKNKNIAAITFNECPYETSDWPVITKIVPIKDIRLLKLQFPIESMIPYYKSSPGKYVSHLIGYEGAGSLLSLLKKMGLCYEICSNDQVSEKNFNFFEIDITLTEKGITSINEIVKIVFQYVNLLKTNEPEYWIHKEIADLSEISFRYKNTETPYEYVRKLTDDLQNYGLEDVLSGRYLISEWKPEKVKEIVNCLRPDNVMIFVVGKEFERVAVSTEPWFGCKYVKESVPVNVRKSWSDASLNAHLALPSKNELIPSNFELIAIDESLGKDPTIVYDNELIRVWYKQNDTFRLPKNSIYLNLTSPHSHQSALNCALTQMFVFLFKDALCEFSYDALLAGLKFNIAVFKQHLVIEVKGFSHKQPLFLEQVASKLCAFEPQAERLTVYKEMFVRELSNFALNQPYVLSQYYLDVILNESYWTKEELLQCVKDITLENLSQFIRKELLANVYLEMFVYGNLAKTDVIKMSETVEKQFLTTFSGTPLKAWQLLPKREMCLPHGPALVHLLQFRNDKHNCSSVDVAFQCGPKSVHLSVMLQLFVQIVDEASFNQLRNIEQLGYIVRSWHRKSNGVDYFNVIVQSEFDPDYVQTRIDLFVDSVEKMLKNLTDDEFEGFRDAVIALILEKPKKLSKAAKILWGEILSQNYCFNKPEIEASVLKKITKQQLIDFYETKIKAGAAQRRKLVVQVKSMMGAKKGAADAEQNGSETPCDAKSDVNRIDDIVMFKKRMGMYPIPKPFIDVPCRGQKCKL